jgi:hypothetical protein
MKWVAIGGIAYLSLQQVSPGAASRHNNCGDYRPYILSGGLIYSVHTFIVYGLLIPEEAG